MKSFEGQFSLQEELDRAGTHKDYLEKRNINEDSSQEDKLRLEKLRLEEVRQKELARLKEFDENKENFGDEYINRFNQFKKRNIN